MTAGHLLLHIITHYIILLHPPLLRIITPSIFTLLVHRYNTLLHLLLLRILPFIITYYNIIITSFLRHFYSIIT